MAEMFKKSKFSYSKLNTYDSCAWKYYLTYKEGHYVFTENINTFYGTLVHFIEEKIGNALKIGEKPDYEQLKKDFYDINIPKTSKFDTKGGVYGINILKEKFAEDFFKTNELGKSFATKAKDYAEYGIYRLEKWLTENPKFQVYGLEHFFSINFNDQILSGFIDRILYNKEDNMYIIEDIKTKDKPFKDEELATPLQFVIYTQALKEIINDDTATIKCVYDLPFCDLKQDAGTKGFMTRGLEKLNKIFTGIDGEDYTPSPSPLCAWCQFSPTNPTQPVEGKGLCPYYSLWTPSHKTFAVAHAWKGMSEHQKILQQELNKNLLNDELNIDFDF